MEDLKKRIVKNEEILYPSGRNLPTIDAICKQLSGRIHRLKERLLDPTEVDEEIILEDEISKCQDLILELNTVNTGYAGEDLRLVKVHNNLEHKLLQSRTKIERVMNEKYLLIDGEVKEYNDIIHKINLLTNVVSSLD